MGNGLLDQPLVYQVIVDISTAAINANSSATTLTFTAPSLPDGVFADNITVTISAVNRFGHGPNTTSNSVDISEKLCMLVRYIPFETQIIRMLMHRYICCVNLSYKAHIK